MPNKIQIDIDLALPDGKAGVQDCNAAELSAAMNNEMEAFDKYMRSQSGQDPLVRAERTLLKTYLAWKILHASKANGTKD
jgi:hypothetical protein